MAGDASNATTPAADRIVFRFILMIDLLCMSGFWPGPRPKRDPASHKKSLGHELITKFCIKRN